MDKLGTLELMTAICLGVVILGFVAVLLGAVQPSEKADAVRAQWRMGELTVVRYRSSIGGPLLTHAGWTQI